MNAPGLPPESALTTNLPWLAGRYQLLDQLGQGGMGAVYRARDVTLGRLVAVKVLPAGKLADPDAVTRFQREAVALARLSHPNIVQAHDSGQDGERHFLVMELVEGQSLATVLAEQGKVAPTRAAAIGRQAAAALSHAHHSGLIHRDVKPSNLLLMTDGTVKLLDLGLARFLQDHIGNASLTRAGAGMGTPDYCAP
jgi:serine/threonine protein kinase